MNYALKRDVPKALRDTAKVCRRCSRWFTPKPREAICDACVPAKARAKRLAQVITLGRPLERPGTAGQGHDQKRSLALAKDVSKVAARLAPRRDPRRLAACAELALAEAARVDYRNTRDLLPDAITQWWAK
jgi:hypothetical protein